VRSPQAADDAHTYSYPLQCIDYTIGVLAAQGKSAGLDFRRFSPAGFDRMPLHAV